MSTFRIVVGEDLYLPIGPDGGDWPIGIVTPQVVLRESDGGGVGILLWNDPSGENADPGSIAMIRKDGAEFAPGQQLQFGSGQTVGTSAYYATAKPYQAPTGTLATKPEPVCAVASNGKISDEGSVMASYAQPASGSSVTVTVDDATVFAGYSVGQRFYTSSTIYALAAGSAFTAPGSLVLQHTGYGGAIVATID